MSTIDGLTVEERGGPERCGPTHYAGCDCREAEWADKLAAAEARAEEGAEADGMRGLLYQHIATLGRERDALASRLAEMERERDLVIAAFLKWREGHAYLGSRITYVDQKLISDTHTIIGGARAAKVKL